MSRLLNLYGQGRNLYMERGQYRPVGGTNMTYMTTTGFRTFGHAADVETSLRRSLRHWTIGIFVSVGSAVFSTLSGLAIGAASLLGLVTQHSGLSVLGTLLIVAAFPLAIIAAHCMDKADEADRAIRLEYCRQHGLKDDDC
jgi:4-hydroxybenzoate polyprenyltransferase